MYTNNTAEVHEVIVTGILIETKREEMFSGTVVDIDYMACLLGMSIEDNYVKSMLERYEELHEEGNDKYLQLLIDSALDMHNKMKGK